MITNDNLYFVFWNIREEKPYYDEPEIIKAYKLQLSGYSGFSIADYSVKEFNVVKDFAKKTDSYILEYYQSNAFHEMLGRFKSDSICVWTKDPDEFRSLMDSMPARNKTVFMKKKLHSKIPYDNFKYYVGTEGVALTYSDPNDTFISIAEHLNLLKVMKKLTQ